MKTPIITLLLLISLSTQAANILKTTLKYSYNGNDSIPISKSEYVYRFGEIYKIYTYHWDNSGWNLASEAKYEYIPDSRTSYYVLNTKQVDYIKSGISPYPRTFETYYYYSVSSLTDVNIEYYGGSLKATINQPGTTGYTGEVLQYLGRYKNGLAEFNSSINAQIFSYYNRYHNHLFPNFSSKKCRYNYKFDNTGILSETWLADDFCEAVKNEYERNSKKLSFKKFTTIIKYEPDSCPVCCYKILEKSRTNYFYNNYDTTQVIKTDLMPDIPKEIWSDIYSYSNNLKIVAHKVDGKVTFKTFYYFEDPTVSLRDILKTDIRIYPNPVKEKLFIPHSKYELFDIFGQRIDSGESNEVTMDKFKPGTYIIRLLNFNVNFRVIKK